MRAAVWHGKKDIRVENVPLPAAPQPGWVQIKVAWCGICGSDLHEYIAGVSLPRLPCVSWRYDRPQGLGWYSGWNCRTTVQWLPVLPWPL